MEKHKREKPQPSVSERVDDSDVGLDLDGLTVEDRRTVAPLPDGVECRVNQERVARNYLEGLNRAIGSDDSGELHATFATELPSQPRVNALDPLNGQRTRRDVRCARPSAVFDTAAR